MHDSYSLSFFLPVSFLSFLLFFFILSFFLFNLFFHTLLSLLFSAKNRLRGALSRSLAANSFLCIFLLFQAQKIVTGENGYFLL